MRRPIVSKLENPDRKFGVVMGLNYEGTEVALKKCHDDARRIKNFLLELCGYKEDNIFMLLDDDNYGQRELVSGGVISIFCHNAKNNFVQIKNEIKEEVKDEITQEIKNGIKIVENDIAFIKNGIKKIGDDIIEIKEGMGFGNSSDKSDMSTDSTDLLSELPPDCSPVGSTPIESNLAQKSESNLVEPVPVPESNLESNPVEPIPESKNTKIIASSKHIPTKENMNAAFDLLLEKANSGYTELWLSFSGHGAYIRNRGDDECLCPIDCDENGFISYDDIYERLISKLPKNVTLFFLADCCHSGPVFNLPMTYNKMCRTNIERCDIIEADIVSISGCKETRTVLNGESNIGALTNAFLESQKEGLTVRELVDNINKKLTRNCHAQVPILNISSADQLERMFM